MSQRLRYCGFEIESAIEFPELERAGPVSEAPPITLEHDRFSIPKAAGLRHGPNWAVGPKESFWWLDGVAKFRVTADIIAIEAQRSAPEGLIRALALEAPFVLAMQYREAFCLTVSAVADGNSVRAFRFLSGGGSSTAAAWQVVRCKGVSLVADTLLRISVDNNGVPLAWPQGSGVLLWPKARKILNVNQKPMLEIRPELPLRRIRLPCCRKPLPLETIYTAAVHQRLQESNHDDADAMQARTPFKIAALRTAGRLWIDAMEKNTHHFRWCLAIAQKCKTAKGKMRDLYPKYRSATDTG